MNLGVIHKFKHDTFFRNTIIFTAASLITSVLNYAYYPIVARMMNVAQFGELQIAASFLLQLSTVFSGLNLISIILVNSNNDEEFGKKIIIALQKIVFWIFVLLSFILVLLSPTLKSYFHFNSIWPFFLIVPPLLISALSVFWTAYLQAKSDFRSLSIYSIATGGGKIAFSAALIAIGFGVNGGLIGIAAGLLTSLIVVRLVTNHTLPKIRETIKLPYRAELRLLKPHLFFTLTVITSLLIMSVLLSIDVFIVKRTFSANTAGHYAGISTISRILFFASAPAVAVMLPLIRMDKLKDSLKVLKRTIIISMSICLIGLAIFSAFPELITVLLLGDNFRESAHYLPMLSILATLATLSNIILNYTLAIGSKISIAIVASSLLSTIVLCSFFHGSIYEIIFSICISMLIGQLSFFAWQINRLGKLRG